LASEEIQRYENQLNEMRRQLENEQKKLKETEKQLRSLQRRVTLDSVSVNSTLSTSPLEFDSSCTNSLSSLPEKSVSFVSNSFTTRFTAHTYVLFSEVCIIFFVFE
jgi:dsDNA-specific endonuclease/ATPase MutS2